MPRSYTQKTIKLLFARSAGKCAICRQALIVKATSEDPVAVIAQIAHICGESDDGPRPCPSMPPQERNSYENLLLLCPNHHAEVDIQPNSYTVEQLREIKQNHEDWVRQQVGTEMPRVSFAELEVVTKAILDKPGLPTSDYKLVPPLEKIEKNHLGPKTISLVTLGMGKAVEVERYVTSISKIDSKFPERLKSGFVAEYNRLVLDGYKGDPLFQFLLTFASGESREFVNQAAGLAVLVYLFQKCEIFDK